MIKKLTTFIVSLCISVSATAECQQPVKRLNKGEQSPCAGFLFSPEKESEVRIKVESYNALQELAKQQDDMNKVLSDRLVLSQKHSAYLSQRLSEEKKDSNLEKLLYFSLGALVTGYIATELYGNAK